MCLKVIGKCPQIGASGSRRTETTKGLGPIYGFNSFTNSAMLDKQRRVEALADGGGGGVGARDMPPLSPNSFLFMKFSAEILSNKKAFQ